MINGIYTSILQKKQAGKKSFVILIDPDKASAHSLDDIIVKAHDAAVDYFFVGGSLMVSGRMDECVKSIKEKSSIPVLLFPGSSSQITGAADALLYLSLISGRNSDLLIGQHVVSAPAVRKSGLEIISTGYMVVDGGVPTTVSYISNATPLPNDKPDIAMCTAMAGELLGMKMIYLDAGSGARKPVSEEMIAAVSSNVSLPLIVGGGITQPEKAYLNCKHGADIIVVGNAIEKDSSLIKELADAVHQVVNAG